MSLAVFICGQSLHFLQGAMLEWSCWFAKSFLKGNQKAICFFGSIPNCQKFSNWNLLPPTEKNKLISDYLLKNDIANQQLHSNVALCGKCKLYPQINTAKRITNGELNVMKKIKCTGNFKEREIIYTAQIYWRYRGKPFRAFLQTSLLHQKQARQHRTCQSQHKR